MCEIILIIVFCKMAYAQATAKNLPGWIFAILTFFFYIGGEIVGVIVGMIAMGGPNAGGGDDFPLVAAGMGIGGGIVGALLSLGIIALVPGSEEKRRRRRRDYDDDDEYDDRPRRRSRRDDDDDDDRFRRDEDDDEPRGKSDKYYER